MKRDAFAAAVLLITLSAGACGGSVSRITPSGDAKKACQAFDDVGGSSADTGDSMTKAQNFARFAAEQAAEFRPLKRAMDAAAADLRANDAHGFYASGDRVLALCRSID